VSANDAECTGFHPLKISSHVGHLKSFSWDFWCWQRSRQIHLNPSSNSLIFLATWTCNCRQMPSKAKGKNVQVLLGDFKCDANLDQPKYLIGEMKNPSANFPTWSWWYCLRWWLSDKSFREPCIWLKTTLISMWLFAPTTVVFWAAATKAVSDLVWRQSVCDWLWVYFWKLAGHRSQRWPIHSFAIWTPNWLSYSATMLAYIPCQRQKAQNGYSNGAYGTLHVDENGDGAMANTFHLWCV